MDPHAHGGAANVKKTKPATRRHKARGGMKSLLTDITVTYRGAPDPTRDHAIRAVFGKHGKYDTDSGYCFLTKTRDFSATVDPRDLRRLVPALRSIRGVQVKRLVKKWVVCR